MKILILSDVHGNIKLMDKILKEHNDSDFKIFLGDFELWSKEEHKNQIKKFDKVVTGNCDASNLSSMYEIIELNSVRILITHGHMFSSFLHKIDFNKLNEFATKNNVTIVLHGHDHISECIEFNGITRFNPGSISYPRNGNKPSYGILEINKNGTFEFKHYYL